MLMITAAIALGVLTVQEPKYGTFKFDPVELVNGKEFKGNPDIFLDHQGYRYLFFSQDSRDKFKARPQAYEIQLGGACGKMAELGGRGSTDRFWVHRKRIYLFASDGCREGFKANPEGHIERDDRFVPASKSNLERGARLIAQVRAWTGFDKLSPQTVITVTNESSLTQGQRTYAVLDLVRIGPGADYFEKSTYDGSGYGYLLQGSKAIEIDPSGSEDPLAPTWKRAVERRRARHIAGILTAKSGGRNQFVFKSSSGGVATVDAYIDRVLTTLRIEEGTGKILGMRVHERNRSGIIGWVDRTYTQYATVDGVTYPISWTATYVDSNTPAPGRQRDKISITR